MHTDYSTQPINIAYAGRIGNECLWLFEVIKSGEQMLSTRSIPKQNQAIILLNRESMQSACKMAIVYVVNLFESFMQDFVCSKERIDIVSDRNLFEQIIKEEFATFLTGVSGEKTNTSKSLMNLHFSFFILHHKYGIRFPSNFSILELGSLRNCIVHHDGYLDKKDRGGNSFYETMPKILAKLSLSNNRIENYNKSNFTIDIIQDIQNFVYGISL